MSTTSITDEDIKDAVSGWDLPAGIHAHFLPETAIDAARVAIVREERWIDEDGQLTASVDIHVESDGEVVGWIDQNEGNGDHHAADVLRVATPDTQDDLDALGRWVEALESSDALSDRAAVERVQDALDEEDPDDYADVEDPAQYGYRWPEVWLESDGLHAAVLSRASSGGVVEMVRHADGTTQRIS